MEQALWSLDGDERDGVVLRRSAQTYMGISGGENNSYAIVGYLQGFGEFVCANGSEGRRQDVVVAGDYNRFESRHVVDLQAVLIAAKYFFEQGALSAALRWEKTA